MTDSKTHLHPKSIREVEGVEMQARDSDEKLTLYKSLSDAFAIQSLLVHQEVLLPGRKASGLHYHSKKEEIFYVISGHPSVWIDGEFVELAPGDFIGYNNKEQHPHMLVNHSSQPATILTIGTNPEDDETTYVKTNK